MCRDSLDLLSEMASEAGESEPCTCDKYVDSPAYDETEPEPESEDNEAETEPQEQPGHRGYGMLALSFGSSQTRLRQHVHVCMRPTKKPKFYQAGDASVLATSSAVESPHDFVDGPPRGPKQLRPSPPKTLPPLHCIPLILGMRLHMLYVHYVKRELVRIRYNQDID